MRAGLASEMPYTTRAVECEMATSAGPPVGLGPEHTFPVLREAARREMGNPIDSSGRSFDPPSLCKSSQDRIRETRPPGLLGRHQTVVLLS